MRNCVEGTDEVRRIARYNGIQPTICLGVIKQHGTNAVAIGDKVKKKLKHLTEILPKGHALGIVTDTTVFIRDSMNELIFTLGMAVFLTSVVCYLFLGTISSAFNVLLGDSGFTGRRVYRFEFFEFHSEHVHSYGP